MLYHAFRGFLLGFGLVAGMLFALIAFVKVLKKTRKQKFDIPELLKAFEKFQLALQIDQHYELISPVRAIVEEIRKTSTYIPGKNDFFIIKPSLEFVIREVDEGESFLRIVKKYELELKKQDNG